MILLAEEECETILEVSSHVHIVFVRCLQWICELLLVKHTIDYNHYRRFSVTSTVTCYCYFPFQYVTLFYVVFYVFLGEDLQYKYYTVCAIFMLTVLQSFTFYWLASSAVYTDVNYDIQHS